MEKSKSSKIKVIFRDKNIIAVLKSAGTLTHATKESEAAGESTLAGELSKIFPEIKKVGDDPKRRPGIVHRLDKNASGVLLVARNQKSFEFLKKLFQRREIEKTYCVLVLGKMKTRRGVINKPIGVKSDSVKRTVHKGKMEKEALTEYKVLKVFEKDKSFFTLLKVSPKTGRTHQIRVHLASVGHPVLGDSVYGKKENSLNLKRLFLHAESLEFNLEDGTRIKIEAGLPKELKTIILKLEKYESKNDGTN